MGHRAKMCHHADLFLPLVKAEHHDGFAMYDSSQTKWDSVEMGPQRDIVGELAEAVRKAGLRWLGSSPAIRVCGFAQSDEVLTRLQILHNGILDHN